MTAACECINVQCPPHDIKASSIMLRTLGSQLQILPMTDVVLTTAAGVAISLVCFLILSRKTKTAQLPLPPGPKGLPLIKNFYDVPEEYPWLTYAAWGRKYRKFLGYLISCRILTMCIISDSDIIHLNILGNHIIILNTARAATELLMKKSAIYSDRFMSQSLIGHGYSKILII
jgi:hypothetical protein